MAVTVAIIAGGAALGGGALDSSGGKKGSGGGSRGEVVLAQIAQQLFTETEPLRAETIQQALPALREGRVDDPTLQRVISSIRSQGDVQKEKLRSNLSKRGLEDSSVGIASMEDIDRAIAQLVSGAEVSELQKLTTLGRDIGFGQTAQQATSAASDLAKTQVAQQVAASKRSSDVGGSVGNAIALLLSRQSRPAGGTVASTSGIEQFYPPE